MGNFFGDTPGNLDDYKKGTKKVPIPTYILGPNDDTQQQFYEFFNITEEQNEICENLQFLGRRGVFTLASGFTLAFLSGLERATDDEKSSCSFDKKDVIALR